MMRILGIDPGLRVTGYGAIAADGSVARVLEAGVITPATEMPLERRLQELHEHVHEVIVATQPEVMVIEELWSSYKNPATAILMGHARGVLCLAACEKGIEVRHLPHSLVKRALTGSGSARKEQVKRMVMQHLQLKTAPEPNDVSDALALALAFANIERTETRMKALGV